MAKAMRTVIRILDPTISKAIKNPVDNAMAVKIPPNINISISIPIIFFIFFLFNC